MQKKKVKGNRRVVRGLLASPYLSLASRLVLGGTFLYAGAMKTFDAGGLAASVRSYGLGLPEWFVTLSAYSLPPFEVLLGLYLLVGLFTRISAWTANGLMVLFILALAQGAPEGIGDRLRLLRVRLRRRNAEPLGRRGARPRPPGPGPAARLRGTGKVQRGREAAPRQDVTTLRAP